MKKLFDKYYILFFWLGLVLLLFPNIIRFLLIMPFSGTEKDYSSWAYFLSRWNTEIIVLAVLFFIFPFLKIFRNGKWIKKIFLILLLLICIFIQYVTNIKFSPDKMFKEPEVLLFDKFSNSDFGVVIIGIKNGNYSKAYPLKYINYHHKVQDTIGNIPVLVTYCSLCRSGRVFSPVVDGIHLHFKVVGLNHENATFEDLETHSWWHQETGEAFQGPLRGKQMEEIFSEQASLGSWIEKYPNALIMQPEEKSKKMYERMGRGLSFTGLVEEQSESDKWSAYQVIIGVNSTTGYKAYLWKDVLNNKLINDELKGVSILVAVENDSLTFHCWSREIDGKKLKFSKDSSDLSLMKDNETLSVWNMKGVCVEGKMKGATLNSMQCYQEYWQAWKTFHPGTAQWNKIK